MSMSQMRRILSVLTKTILLTTLILIGLAFVLPMLYKKEIAESIRKAINDNIYGEFRFEEANLTLFRNFPSLNLEIHKPELFSYNNEDTSRIFAANEFVVFLDLWNIISRKETLRIEGIELNKPEITIIQYNDSISNFDIVKETKSEKAQGEEGFDLDINQFNISEGNIAYKDLANGMNVFLTGINQELNGIFRKKDLDIKTRTHVGSLSLESDGISYLNKAKLDILLDLAVQGEQSKYIIKTGEFSINELDLLSSGSLALSDDGSMQVDVLIRSKETKVKDLFSLIPSSFKGSWDQVSSTGAFKFNGTIKGQYSDSLAIYPTIKFDLNVNDGSVKYPGMQFSLDQINLDISAMDMSNKLDQTTIDIKKFDFSLNNRPFSGKLRATDIQRDFYVAGNINGSVSLSDFSKFMPLEQGTSLEGLIDANLIFDFNKGNLEKQNFENSKIGGTAKITDLRFADTKSPELKISTLSMIFSQTDCNIDQMQLQYGRTDCKGSCNIKNPMSMLMDAGEANISLNLFGNVLDLDEFMATDSIGVESEKVISDNNSAQSNPLSGINLNLKGEYASVKYEDYRIKNAKTEIQYYQDLLKIKSFTADINDNYLSVTGDLNSIMAYANNSARLEGNLFLKGKDFDVMKFMATEEGVSAESTSESEVFEVPTGMDINLNFDFDKILYDKWQFNNSKGHLAIADHEIQIRKFNSSTLGGNIGLLGLYNSRDIKKPVFDLKYEMSKVSFGRAFESIDMVRRIAPIFKFIEGNFNTTLVCSGAMDQAMNPVYSSIILDGFIETLDGMIKNYSPLEKISQKLGVDELKNYSLQNTKNWIHMEDGTLKLSPGERKIKDINVKYKGSHQVAGDMDYQFVFRIPKSKFKNSIVGDAAESGMQFVTGLASKSGFELKTKSHINLAVNLTGKLLDPKIGFKVVGEDGDEVSDEAKGMVSEAVHSVADSARKRADAELSNLKKKALDQAKKTEDSLRVVAAKKIQEEKDKAINKAAEELKKNVDSNLVNKGKEVLGEKATKEAEKIIKEGGKREMDQIKDKVNEWNPFKKKKE